MGVRNIDSFHVIFSMTMTSDIGWWWERQHVGPLTSQLPSVSYMDKLMENFSCLEDDEYFIEGEMGMQVCLKQILPTHFLVQTFV